MGREARANQGSMPDAERDAALPAAQPEPAETKANVEAFKIRPLGDNILVVAELPPVKSKDGMIDLPADPTVEDFFRKGIAVAVGPDVKRVKVGQKIVYPFNDVYEMERYYRRTWGTSAISKWIVRESAVVAIMEPAVMEEPKVDDVIHTLKASDLQSIRAKHYENLESMARSKMGGKGFQPQGRKIMTPEEALGRQ